MLNIINRNNHAIVAVLFSLFFVSLVFSPNDVNSKVIILIGLFSLVFFDLDQLKTYAKQHYILLVLFLLVCFSLIYTTNIDVGLKKVERIISIPASILIFALLTITKKNAVLILKVFAAVVLLATLYSHYLTILNFLENGETSFRRFFNLNYSYQALGSTLGLHPTYYSYFILTAIALLLHFLQKKTTTWIKISLVLTLIYLSFFIVHLSSRIAIIALYLIFILNILLFAIKQKAIRKSLLLLILLHFFLFVGIWNVGVTKYRFQHIFGFTYYTGYKVDDGNHKLRLWNAALNANDNFIFGNGMGDVDSSLQEEFATADLVKAVKDKYNSHNQYIEYYVGLGMIGALVFCYLLFYYARVFYKARNLVGLQFILLTAILCFTECLFNRHHGIVFFVFMLGLLWHKGKPIQSKSVKAKSE